MNRPKFLLICFALLFEFQSEAQINIPDSTMKVAGHWKKNETKVYNVAIKKIGTYGKDTVDRELIKYNAHVTILDSTANSYTIEWVYKNYDIVEAKDFMRSFQKDLNTVKLIYKTDALGVFKELINWKDILQQLKDKNVDSRMASKEGIESYFIPDIQQFHAFHGATYTLHKKYEEKVSMNTLAHVPVAYVAKLEMEELNLKNNSALFRHSKEYNTKQMTDAMYSIIVSRMAATGIPSRRDVPDMNMWDGVVCRVHGPSGWIISSVQTRLTTSEFMMNFEERQIEILE